MKIKKLLALLLVAVMVMSLTTACGGNDTQPQNGTQTPTTGNDSSQTPPPSDSTPSADQTSGTGEPDADQYINYSLGSEPSTLDNSVAADSYSNYITVNVFEPLVRLEEDEEGNNVIRGAGAESWESNEDGTVWTFHLRDNKWSDGEAVTAEHYAYGIRRTLLPETGSPSAYLIYPIKNAEKINMGDASIDELGVKVIDEKTLEITLEGPTPYFMEIAYQRPMYPLRQDIVEKHGDKYGSEAETTIYNGPFVLDSWVHNSKLVLKKNPNYWDKDSVKLETVTYNIIQEESARYNSLDNNSIDITSASKTEWINKFGADERLKNVKYTMTSTYYMFFNHNDDVFKNANIRKAFTIAVNREELSQVIFAGVNEAAYGWIPKNIFVGSEEFRANAGDPILDLKNDNPDPKALLIKGMEELGLGSDPATLPVTLSLAGTDQWFRTYGEYLQQSFKATLGVNLEISFNEWPIFESNVQKGDFQMGYMSWGADYNDPMSMLDIIRTGSTAVNTGWSNAEFDSILDEASTEMDDAKRMELYKKAERIAMYDECVLCPVVYPTYNGFAYKFVQNVPTTPLHTMGDKYIYTTGR